MLKFVVFSLLSTGLISESVLAEQVRWVFANNNIRDGVACHLFSDTGEDLGDVGTVTPCQPDCSNKDTVVYKYNQEYGPIGQPFIHNNYRYNRASDGGCHYFSKNNINCGIVSEGFCSQ